MGEIANPYEAELRAEVRRLKEEAESWKEAATTGQISLQQERDLLSEQADELADVLLALVVSRNVAKPGTTQPGDPPPEDWAAAVEALRKAGRLS